MIELTDIFPRELKAIFDSLSYEEEGDLKVHLIKYLDNELHFDFSLFLGDQDQNSTQHWQLQVLNYRDSKIDIDNLGSYFHFYSNHFLLWKYIDKETELYFKKKTTNPHKLLSDIYAVHNTVFENYISIEKFLNGKDLLALCKSDIGLFARGPERILKHYYDCLHQAEKEPYFFGDFIPKKWNGEKWIPEDKNFKVAFLGGTYFIGQEFKFKRIDK